MPGSAGTRKVRPIWILLKQETLSCSGISWAICKSAPRSRQITTPAPHRFLQAGCPSCHPTNSIKPLKTTNSEKYYLLRCQGHRSYKNYHKVCLNNGLLWLMQKDDRHERNSTKKYRQRTERKHAAKTHDTEITDG